MCFSSFGSSGSLRLLVALLFGGPVAINLSRVVAVEGGAALDAEAVDSAVLGAVRWLFAVFPVLHELCHGLVGQIFIEVLIVDLDHRSVDASTKALDLLERKQTISAGVAHSHSVEILHCLDDVSCLQTVIELSIEWVHEL